MALQKIFLADPVQDWEKVGNSMSTFYRFDGSTLTIRWKGREKSMPARAGDGIYVNCHGGFPSFGKIKMPKNRGEKVLWLLGFPKELRKQTPDDVEAEIKELENYAERNDMEFGTHVRVWETYSRGKFFLVYHEIFEIRRGWLAGWVSDNITNEDIRELFKKHSPVYPDWWVEKCLFQ